MAEQVRNYQCPNCTGPLRYDGPTGKLVCDHCGSSFDVKEIEALYTQQVAARGQDNGQGAEAATGTAAREPDNGPGAADRAASEPESGQDAEAATDAAAREPDNGPGAADRAASEPESGQGAEAATGTAARDPDNGQGAADRAASEPESGQDAEATTDAAARESGSGWDYSGMSKDWGEAAPHMRVYQCPSCGAELICDDTTGATSCPYCGNPAIIPGQFSGILKPDYVIPFRKDKAAAIAGLKEHCKGKPFLPSHFREEDKLGTIQGMYVPFWLFDGKAEGRIVCETTRVHVARMGDEEITRTDFFHVEREGTMAFDKVPVDASSRMADDWMDSIEPFDYGDLQPFSAAYLAGYLADRYDVSAEASAARADQRCEASLVSALRNSVQGYNSCQVQGREVHLSRGKVHYALLPVWVLHTKWRGKDYMFMMNGQTGRMVGNLPVSPARFAALFGLLTAAMTVALTLFSLLIGR